MATQPAHVHAFAALILNDQEVGPRMPCLLTFSRAGLTLDRELKFGPAPADGFGTIRFFNSPEGGKGIFDYWGFGSVVEDGGSRMRQGQGVHLS